MKSLSTITRSNNNGKELAHRQDLLPSTRQRINEIVEHFGNYQTFCARCNPDNIPAATSNKEKSITCSSPSLTHMDLAWGDGASVSWLIVQLTSFQEKINIPYKMTPHQLEACAILIKNTFGYLKTTEIMLFLGMVLGGDFSINFHGYIQPSIIVDAIRDNFIPYRNKILDDIHKREQEEQRKQDLLENPPITWEEHCKRTGIDKPNPLEQL